MEYKYYDKEKVKDAISSIDNYFQYAVKQNRKRKILEMLKNNESDFSEDSAKKQELINNSDLNDFINSMKNHDSIETELKKKEYFYDRDNSDTKAYRKKGAQFLKDISKEVLELLGIDADFSNSFSVCDSDGNNPTDDGKNSNKMKEYGQATLWSDGLTCAAIVCSYVENEPELCVRTYIAVKDNAADSMKYKESINESVKKIDKILGDRFERITKATDGGEWEVRKYIIEYKDKTYNQIVNDLFKGLIVIKAFNTYIQNRYKSKDKENEEMNNKLEWFMWSLKCADDFEWNLSPAVFQINDLVFNDCKQIILTGAPGTGKTYSIKEYIKWQLISQYLYKFKDDVEKYIEKSEKIKKALNNNDEDKTIKQIIDGKEDQPGWAMVQFHPSFDYTDFVEGLRPVKVKTQDEKVETSFVRMDGVFKKFCRQAASVNEKRFFFIDEINRSDLSKVFGELMFCLEEGYRGQEHSIKTQYANLDTYVMDEKKGYAIPICVKIKKDDKVEEIKKILEENKEIFKEELDPNQDKIKKLSEEILEEIKKTFNTEDKTDIYKKGFYIPENVILLGSMNDIDRSVDTFDFALRRRFRWQKVKVDRGLLRNTFSAMNNQKFSEEETEKLVNSVLNMNSVFDDYKQIFRTPEDYYIGPAYFKSLFEGDTKNSVWANKVEPILREYVRGRDKAEEFINNCRTQFEKTSVKEEMKYDDMFRGDSDRIWKIAFCKAIEKKIDDSEGVFNSSKDLDFRKKTYEEALKDQFNTISFDKSNDSLVNMFSKPRNRDERKNELGKIKKEIHFQKGFYEKLDESTDFSKTEENISAFFDFVDNCSDKDTLKNKVNEMEDESSFFKCFVYNKKEEAIDKKRTKIKEIIDELS